MRVLMQNRMDAFKNLGGDTIQMLKTKDELEKLGVDVDISLELEPNLDEYDIVHLFNITRIHETWMQCMNAKKQNKLVAISTIHHNKKEIKYYEKTQLLGIARVLKLMFNSQNKIQLIKTFCNTLKTPKEFKAFYYQIKIGFIKEQLDALKYADIIFPNSNMEFNQILEDFGLNEKDINNKIIPNGIDLNENLLSIKAELFIKKFGLKDFIFCPGRIEPMKNQLNIIKALKKTNIKVVFAGALNKKHKKYCNTFFNEVKNNKNIFYIGLLNREMIFSAYKAAKVSVLASWFETTGLVGLEGAINDCNVVMTEKGYTKEYYKSNVYYCNPEDIESIKNACISALNEKVNQNLKLSILKRYTWENAASKTLDGYKNLLGINV